MDLRLNNIDYINNVLNRSKHIIDEYNDKLVNDNEYAHINIIRDIEKSIEKLNDIKYENELLNLLANNFNNQDRLSLYLYIIEEFNDDLLNKIKTVLEISLLKNYIININSKKDVFNGNYYIINMEKKNENN